MANFIGTKFIFNGVSSDEYNLILVKVGEDGMIPTSIGAGRTPIEDWVINRSIPFYYKTRLEPRTLNITLTLDTSATPTLTWDANTRKNIFNWLYGSFGYKDFQSSDSNYIDKIIFTNPLEFTTADLVNGYITLSAQSLPNRYTPIQTTTLNISSTPITTSVNSLQNMMSLQGDYYFYPRIIATIGSSQSLRIVNNSDSGRVFEVTGLVNGETITVDNELKILSATSSSNLISKLTNKNWFRLKNGTNSLTIETNGTVSIIAQYPILA